MHPSFGSGHDSKLTTMSLDDSPNEGEAEAEAERFGGEERLEQTAFDLLAHSDSVIDTLSKTSSPRATVETTTRPPLAGARSCTACMPF